MASIGDVTLSDYIREALDDLRNASSDLSTPGERQMATQSADAAMERADELEAEVELLRHKLTMSQDRERRLRSEVAALGNLSSEEARLRGEAEGRLEASEWPGVIAGWQARCHREMRLFNRLEAAISHHKAATDRQGFTETWDDALYDARDKVLRDAHEGKG